jgi:hypothetical protein
MKELVESSVKWLKVKMKLLQIMVFFTREIGQKGPKSDIDRLDQGAILDKSISIMSILASGLLTNYALSF